PRLSLSPYTTLFRSFLSASILAARYAYRDGSLVAPTIRVFSMLVRCFFENPIPDEGVHMTVLFALVNVRKRNHDSGLFHIPEFVDRKSTRLNSSHVK